MEKTDDPTLRQLQVLRVIAEGAKSGMTPTLREISDELDIVNHYAVVCHIDALEERGLIEKQGASRARALRVTEKGLRFLGGRRCEKCGQEVLQ